MLRHTNLTLFLILLLVVTSFPVNVTEASGTYDGTGTGTINFTLAFVVGISIALALLAIQKLIASVFQSWMMDVAIKTAFMDLIISSIIVVGIIIFFGSVNLMFVVMDGSDPVYTEHADMIDLANSTLSATSGILETSVKRVTKQNFILTKYTTFSYSKLTDLFGLVPDPMPVEYRYNNSGAPGGGYSIFSSALNQIITSLSQLLAIIYSKQLILELIKLVVPLYLFPLAITLKVIPMTQRIGSTLLAISIGLMFIYPTALVFSYEMSQTFMTPGINPSPAIPDPEDEGHRIPAHGTLCSPWFQSFAALGDIGLWLYKCIPQCTTEAAIAAAAVPPVAWLTTFWACFNFMTGHCYLETAIVYDEITVGYQLLYSNRLNNYADYIADENTFNKVYESVVSMEEQAARTYVSTIISTVLEIVITIGLIKALAGVLGGDLNIPGLSKMI